MGKTTGRKKWRRLLVDRWWSPSSVSLSKSCSSPMETSLCLRVVVPFFSLFVKDIYFLYGDLFVCLQVVAPFFSLFVKHLYFIYGDVSSFSLSNTSTSSVTTSLCLQVVAPFFSLFVKHLYFIYGDVSSFSLSNTSTSSVKTSLCLQVVIPFFSLFVKDLYFLNGDVSLFAGGDSVLQSLCHRPLLPQWRRLFVCRW